MTNVEKPLSDAMIGVGLELSPDMLSKCVTIATNHNLSPTQMATSWEAHSLNSNVSELNIHTFPSYCSVLLKEHAPNFSSKPGAIVPRPIMAKRSAVHDNNISNKKRITPDLIDNSLKTPDRDSVPNSSTSSAIVTPSKSKPNENRYENRSNAGNIVASYNPHNLPELSSTENRTCVITQPESFPNLKSTYLYMKDTNRSKALDSQLTKMHRLMLESYPIDTTRNHKEQQLSDEKCMSELEITGIPRQSLQTNIGRICNEAHTGKINSTSILLEGDRLQSNGARIPLDVNVKDGLGYSLFPGQLVAVEGMNATGRKMIIERIHEGLPPMSHSQNEVKDLTEDSNGLKAFVVAGPYTTNRDLEYQPLLDLLGSVVSDEPDVVFLMGPFVDITQPLLKDGEVVLEYAEEDGNNVKRHVTYETLFAAKIARELEDLYEDEDLRTKFVLVPSMNDAVAEHVYPQPPLKDTFPNGMQIAHFPETESIPYGSLCLDSIETAGGKTQSEAHKDPRIYLVSNPSTVKINNFIIGVTSTDALFHLSTEETNTNLPPGSRLTRLAEHLLDQRSYYPLYPPPSNVNMNLDVSKNREYSIPVQPDLLILPSKLTSFVKDVKGGTIVINPGNLVRGDMGGTFAVVNLHPVDRVLSENKTIDNYQGVKNRARVEIRRI